ncbi:OmpA family protein, partial [Acidiphilium sp. 34-64-41]|uniref:OmpA family protein n=1 Tax=Acidiphilium sp. 34-64-41 TaxID=1970297 RepID=UPI00338E59DA
FGWKSKPSLSTFYRPLANASFEARKGGGVNGYGSAAFDRALGLRRAEAVADFLAAHGVDRSLMKVVSHGSTQPLGGKPSPPLHEKINRNVIVTIQFQHYRGQH